MKIVDSEHWQRKRKYRKDITNDAIEYAIKNSNVIMDNSVNHSTKIQNSPDRKF